MYAQFLQAGYRLPPKYALFIGAWLALCAHKNAPLPGTREIDLEEWAATPVEYQTHPSMHPKLFGRAPGESSVPNAREELFAKHGGGASGGHGHGHH